MSSVSNIDSFLFEEVRRGRLPHPTARNFDESKWQAAFKKLGAGPSARDESLAVCAVFFGRQIQSLRTAFEPKLFEGLDRRTAIALCIAAANHNYITLDERGKNEARKRARKTDALHIGFEGRQPFQVMSEANIATGDTATSTIVDILPHCLERAANLSGSLRADTDFSHAGAKIFLTLSIEHGLRGLWQSALWSGWVLKRVNDAYHFGPADIDLATHWFAWIWRQEDILGRSMLDRLQEKAGKLSSEQNEPFLTKTVVGVGGKSKETRKFQFGEHAARESGQVWHRTEQSGLEASYLDMFMDAPLPNLNNRISCRDLQSMWCVIRDASQVLRSKHRGRSLEDMESVEQLALVIRQSELVRALVSCLNVSDEDARSALNFFTSSLSDIGSLFNDKLWSAPIVPLDGDNVAIVLPSIAVGSPTRRVEGWLERGGLSDNLSNVGRGTKYEVWVREQLREAVESNEIFASEAHGVGFLPRSEGEQIDVIVRVGRLFVIGEVKCLLAPVEPIDQFTYLARLDEAGKQAIRKAKWARENPSAIARAFKTSERDVQTARFVPIVIINQGVGHSYDAAGARVVDFHFLRLYLQDKDIVVGAAVRFEDGANAFKSLTLYENATGAQDDFEKVMANPAPLRRYLDAAEWRENKFPLRDGDSVSIAVCFLGEKMKRELNEAKAVLGRGG